MSPSTSATFAAAANGFSFVMCREFAITLYPRLRNASTSPAPIPRDAPVTIAVFVVFAICVLPFSVLLALSPLTVWLQGPPLFPLAEESQTIRWPTHPTPSQCGRSGGHRGPLHLQRCRRCRTSPARA